MVDVGPRLPTFVADLAITSEAGHLRTPSFFVYFPLTKLTYFVLYLTRHKTVAETLAFVVQSVTPATVFVLTKRAAVGLRVNSAVAVGVLTFPEDVSLFTFSLHDFVRLSSFPSFLGIFAKVPIQRILFF